MSEHAELVADIPIRFVTNMGGKLVEVVQAVKVDELRDERDRLRFAVRNCWMLARRNNRKLSGTDWEHILRLCEEADSSIKSSVLRVEAALTPAGGGERYETIQTVTAWANETFGPATIRTQIARAEKEFVELLQLQEVDHDNAQLAEEAADVCICLYRVIGTLDPEAINKKMAKNRARKWKVDGQGTAQHVGE